MTWLRFSLLTAFVFCLTTVSVQSQSQPLTIGEIRTLKSEILKEDRVLNIYLPQDYDKDKAYPVIYLLDGSRNEDFLHVVGLVQFFNMTFQMPDFIVVGIANVDRKRDFTFHTDLADLKKSYPTTGHSEAFIDFIEKELQPFIASTYKTDGTKYIIGQSLGGLLATEILLKKPELFSHYLIVSPSLWWDNESLMSKMDGLLSVNPKDKKYVYVAVGKDEDRVMQREASELSKVLGKHATITSDYMLMEKDNHATILHNALYQGLLKLFPYKN
ncbi:alpha/beta hydrolase [Flavobacterium silvaticum]|uniref:Alpha/beta hydrolase n=1 Tax=Flavobacterium silvaticum TaxID=1852020 RepID=A0A972JF09_9FLAO|nr:alpha/beta hydrolase-fold protein [Flavobacterium silvaticum]NMH27464.1 alpha/beta hydrolase [Flavobacterium silvaticum]